jgi:dihydropteroate synthase
MKLSGKNFNFNFSVKTHIMGILNVTPDSFSDGGHFFNRDRAIEQALRMQTDGADIIDIGGESTRPGSEPVSVRDEISRTIPVIQSLVKAANIPVSIDTCKSQVADAALSAGASIVNDISGLRFDKKMAHVIARHKAPVAIMHIKGTPKNMQNNPVYKALIPEIMDSLRESIAIAEQAGIPGDRIIIDPGIGFGKTVAHNLEIIRRLDEFAGFEKPVLLGPSRKSFIGKVLGDLPVTERLEGTAAAVAAAILKGAHILRVHDVKEMVRVARLADAIKKGL